MKANELVYGIYVYFNCFDGSKIIVKVTGFKDDFVYGVSEYGTHWCQISKIEPIPLTAEIMEKNLSTTSQIQYCWDDFLSHSFGEDFYEIRYHGDVTELVISIRYVHELQHVLKLCKIEKEVVL